MKNSKKIMSALLCLVMAVSCFCFNAIAANATVGAGSASCKSGETVNVPVYIKGNSGITNIEVKLSFDSTLLEAVEAKSENAVFNAQNPEINGNYISYLAYNTETVTNNGNLFVVTFKAITDEAVNAELKVEVTAANNVVEDVQSQIATSDGSIAIGGAGAITTETQTVTETQTKAPVIVTEPTTEITTKGQVVTNAPVTEATTHKVVVTEASTETTSKAVTTEKSTESTTSRTTTTKKHYEEEEDTETTTRGGKSSSKASVSAERTTAEQQSEENTNSDPSANPAGTVSVVIGQSIITINGSQKSMDAAAYIQTSSNSTMVPLRFVSEAVAGIKGYGAIVDWDNSSKTATIKYDKNTISFKSGSNIITVNGKTSVMENGVCAEIKNNRMYIPFRALGNALDVNVNWNAQTKTATFSVN